MAMRRHGLPSESIVTPIILPGIFLEYVSLVLRKPAWGPPKPMGTPKRWAEPTAMSAPQEAGEESLERAIRSVAHTSMAPAAWRREAKEEYVSPGDSTEPYVLGYWTMAPQ